MNKLYQIATVTFITLSVLVWAPQGAARINCWTNNDGIRECGDTIPPEYSQKGHETLSGQGVVVDSSARAKTPEELEAERVEQERLRAEEEARQKQAQLDRVLLDTYSNVDDIEMARDGKIVALESRIKLTETHLAKLQQNLDEQIAQAAKMERGGQQPSGGMVQNIESTREQITNNQDFINRKRAEIEEIRQSYANDIERFIELKQPRIN